MPRAGRQHQGVGCRPQHLHELQRRGDRCGRREDARMDEHTQCVAAHRSDQHVHIDEDQSSGAVHDVEQRGVVGEVDSGTQTLPAVDGRRLAHPGGRFDTLHLLAQRVRHELREAAVRAAGERLRLREEVGRETDGGS